MNQVIFGNSGGIKMYQELLQEMQTNYNNLFNAIGVSEKYATMAGQVKLILAGCELITGSTYDAGFIILNGEILYFQGGVQQTYLKVEETIVNKAYADGSSQPLYKRRSLVFSGDSGTAACLWAELIRVKSRYELWDMITKRIETSSRLYSTLKTATSSVINSSLTKMMGFVPSATKNATNLKITFDAYYVINTAITQYVEVRLYVNNLQLVKRRFLPTEQHLHLTWSTAYTKNTEVAIYATTPDGQGIFTEPILIVESLDAYTS